MLLNLTCASICFAERRLLLSPRLCSSAAFRIASSLRSR